MTARSIIEEGMPALAGSAGNDLHICLATGLKRDGYVRTTAFST